VQRPHPPIVVGGHSRSALRRAVLAGNGWYGWTLDVPETARALEDLREIGRTHSRPPGLGELEITITPPGVPDIETARRYAELGVHRLAIQPHTMEGSTIDELIAKVGQTLTGRV
jgi:alkanesulfonate monooxygenase SsuD/methylene tetrahydromethanopterin reductase-like flavin-dependent oxidoreductase (luciferase family)